MAKVRLTAAFMLLPLAVWVSGAVSVQGGEPPELTAASVAELKASYLACEQLAATTLLDFGTAAACSLVAQELLVRGFGGNFKPLLEWWHSARNACRQEDAGCGNAPPFEPGRP